MLIKCKLIKQNARTFRLMGWFTNSAFHALNLHASFLERFFSVIKHLSAKFLVLWHQLCNSSFCGINWPRLRPAAASYEAVHGDHHVDHKQQPRAQDVETEQFRHGLGLQDNLAFSELETLERGCGNLRFDDSKIR